MPYRLVFDPETGTHNLRQAQFPAFEAAAKPDVPSDISSWNRVMESIGYDPPFDFLGTPIRVFHTFKADLPEYVVRYVLHQFFEDILADDFGQFVAAIRHLEPMITSTNNDPKQFLSLTGFLNWMAAAQTSAPLPRGHIIKP